MAEIISGPILSVALVIMAGLALRYAIWNGRDQKDDTQGRTEEWQERNRALGAALEQSQIEQRELQDNLHRTQQDYLALKKSIDESQLQQRQESYELRETLDSMQTTQAESEAEAVQARAQLAEVGERAAALAEELSLAQQTIESMRQAHSQTKSSANESMAELKTTNQNLKEQLDDARRQIEGLEATGKTYQHHGNETAAQLKAVAVELQQAEARGNDLENTRQRLESELEAALDRVESGLQDRQAVSDQLVEMTRERDHLLEHQATFSQQIEQLLTQRDQLLQQRDQLGVEREQMQADMDQMQHASDDVETLKQQLAFVNSEVSKREDQWQEQLESAALRESQLQSELAQAEEDLVQHRREADANHAELTTRQGDLESTLDQLQSRNDDLEQQNAELEAIANEARQSQQTLQLENDDFVGQARHWESRCTELTQQIEQLQSGRDEAQELHAQLEIKYRQAISKLEETQLESESLQKSNALLQADSRLVESLRAELQDAAMRTSDMQQELQHLRQEMVRFDEIESGWKQELANKDSQLQKTLNDLRHHEDLVRKNGEVESQIEAKSAALNEKVNLLRTEKDELARGVLREQSAVASLREELSQLEDNYHHQGLELRELQLFREERLGLAEELSKLKSELAAVQSANGQFVSEKESLQRELTVQTARADRFEIEAHDQGECTADLRGQLESVQRELVKDRRAKTMLEELVHDQAETLARLRQDSASIESLLERQANVQSSLQQHADRLRAATVEPNIEATAETHPASADEAILTFGGSDGYRMDDALGMVYERPPATCDDLKRISGIGEILEQKLNQLGIFKYEQIMAWTPEAILQFSKLLAFRDRIQRDDWVAQARRLAEIAQTKVA